MKIAYLSTFYPYRGGIAQFNASLYQELIKSHDVKAFTFTRQYPDLLFPGETQYVTKDDKVPEIPATRILDTLNPFSYYKTARAIRAYEPDLLIMKYWMSFFAPSLGTVAKKMNPNTKVLTILDNVIPHEKKPFDRSLTRYFLKQNTGFIAMSDSVQKDLHSFLPDAPVLLREHPSYDHFGSHMDPIKAKQTLGIHPEKKTLLFFGFIRDYKGLDLLIEAFNQLDESYQLIIAGECYGSFDKYSKMIEQSPRRTDIHAHNQYISDDQVAAYFCASDVCVLPYRSATQSGISAISHYFYLPQIVTDVGGLKETIRVGVNGLVAEQAQADAIANAIRTYFESNLKGSFVNALKAEQSENSWANFSEKLIDFANQL